MPEKPEKLRCIATHVPLETAQKLKQLSALTNRSMAQIHSEALEEYLARVAPNLPTLYSAT